MAGFEAQVHLLGMTAAQLRRLRDLIAQGHEARFYWWQAWVDTRAYVLALDRYECQACKTRGRYSRATLVHHVKHLKARPDLALSVFDPETGERQLVSLCKSCHEEAHPESLKQFSSPAPPLTAERWD